MFIVDLKDQCAKCYKSISYQGVGFWVCRNCYHESPFNNDGLHEGNNTYYIHVNDHNILYIIDNLEYNQINKNIIELSLFMIGYNQIDIMTNKDFLIKLTNDKNLMDDCLAHFNYELIADLFSLAVDLINATNMDVKNIKDEIKDIRNILDDILNIHRNID